MMDRAPKVSVVVPAYNAERFLAACLDSILAQRGVELEVIVVDDGSTDRTGDITQQYGPRVRCHRQENGGVASALNAGLLLAAGEYISLVASDDGLCPGATETQARVLDEHPTVGLVHGSAQEIDSAGRAIGYRGQRTSARIDIQPSERAVRALLRGNHIVCSSVMIRRVAFEQLGGFRQDFVPGEDWEMWTRVATAYDVAYVARPLALRRIHDASLTAGFTVEVMAASHARVLDALFTNGPLSGLDDLERYARACNDRSLAWLAANTRRRGPFLRYIGRALGQEPSLARERETYGALVDGAKTLLPRPVIDAARRVRQQRVHARA
ncbi:MAG: glycosyltransferase [Dehalococcoidia bacterium]